MGQDHAEARPVEQATAGGTVEDTALAALRFILVLAIGGFALMAVRALDPWILDRVAIYVGLSFAVLALIAAVVGLLRA